MWSTSIPMVPVACFFCMLPRGAIKKVIMHGHSTKEDFENSFIGSNLFAPLFGKYLTHMYKKGGFHYHAIGVFQAADPVLWGHYTHGGCVKRH